MTGAPEGSINEPLRRRLPRYYRVLLRLYAEGHEVVSSETLSSLTGIAPSQVRGDMSSIGCYGQTGYGYRITKLYRRLGEVLHLCDCYSAVIVGGGALAAAVSECALFTRRGVKLVGRIGTDGEESVGQVVASLVRLCEERRADILILACGEALALACAEKAEELGISGILNLSDVEIVSERLTVRDLHIEDPLMMLCSSLPEREQTDACGGV